MPAEETPISVIDQEKKLICNLVSLQHQDEIIFNDTGWDSRVYIINNGKYCFKFPRSEKIQQRYKYEIAAIKLAQNINSTLDIPKIVWEHPDNTYFGYEGLIGTSLAEIVTSLSNEEKHVIGNTLGSFLRQFHHLTLFGARDMSIPEEMKQLQFWYDKGLPIINKVFTAAEQKKFRTLVYEDCPKKLSELGSDGALCHGDLGFWNVIYKGEGQIGMIDFGDICNCDSSKDFIGFDEDIILEAAINAYGDSELLRQKIDARRIIPEVISLRFYWEKQDQAGVDKTVPRIKAILNHS